MTRKKSTNWTPPVKSKSIEPKKEIPVASLPRSYFFSFSFKHQALFLGLLGFALYFNSLFNEYAFDDGLVIQENDWVQNGVSGIKDILTHDELEGFYAKYGTKGQFTGGRYRPLSIVTFALEHQFFGENPMVRHAVNILLFVATLILMLYFLRTFIFPKNRDVAFLAVLLFAVHPVHSEVVANVKNRSELMALFFYLPMFISAFRFAETKNFLWLLATAVSLFLSLLSKEHGALMIILLPLAIYIFQRDKIPAVIITAVAALLTVGIFLYIRYVITDFGVTKTTEVLNNQYIKAEGNEAFATKIAVLLRYIKVLFLPHPLSADYSYNQIPFVGFTSPAFVASFLVYAFLSVLAVYYCSKRHVVGYFLMFFLGHVFVVSNLMLEIGTTYGERLIYLGSFAFCVILAYYALKGVRQLKTVRFDLRRKAFIGVLGLVVVLSMIKIVERNAIWKNDISLFLNDVNISPNSVVVLGNASKACLLMAEKEEDPSKKDAWMRRSMEYSQRAVKIHPEFLNGYINLGLAQMYLKDLFAAEQSFIRANEIFSAHPKVRQCLDALSERFLFEGIRLGTEEGNLTESIRYMQKSLQLTPDNPEIYYNLGGAYYTLGDFKTAKQHWDQCLELQPSPETYCNLGGAFAVLGDNNTAIRCWTTCLEYFPDYEPALTGLQALTSKR